MCAAVETHVTTITSSATEKITMVSGNAKLSYYHMQMVHILYYSNKIKNHKERKKPLENVKLLNLTNPVTRHLAYSLLTCLARYISQSSSAGALHPSSSSLFALTLSSTRQEAIAREKLYLTHVHSFCCLELFRSKSAYSYKTT